MASSFSRTQKIKTLKSNNTEFNDYLFCEKKSKKQSHRQKNKISQKELSLFD